MQKNKLGNTGIEVSRLCFGSLTMGPLQRNLSAEEGAALILYGISQGINFIDTAELYGTYPHIKEALKQIKREDLVIASKCYAYSRETAQESFEFALHEMGVEYIDIFLLHEQMSVHTIKGHYEAIEYFLEQKLSGRIKAFGISTHYIEGVRAAIKYPEIEIVHPITNRNGLGIADGTIEEMIQALKAFKNRGGGIYGMKPLGGGNLLSSVEECFDFVLSLEELDSIAFGMQNFDEIDYNVKRINGEIVPESLKKSVSGLTKQLQIADWCTGCGRCVKKCDHKALKIVDSFAVVDRTRCVLCGYCASVCVDFCIKVY